MRWPGRAPTTPSSARPSSTQSLTAWLPPISSVIAANWGGWTGVFYTLAGMNLVAAILAFIVLKPDVQSGDALVQDLQEFVKQQIAPYKYPRAIQFCDALPRTNTGKLQRFKLRELSA